ncbi:MAG: hypothetical protein EZS28_020458 [Streblomastix strix]|uniref:Uncharacterized protein n=1 Tax=Streblomastix strix TaxID=222440 RepID=A0A5J4VNF6_9EUKA|nr:MAG: hypothetical protein EZS28_020458 [Streblomastix strix]
MQLTDNNNKDLLIHLEEVSSITTVNDDDAAEIVSAAETNSNVRSSKSYVIQDHKEDDPDLASAQQESILLAGNGTQRKNINNQSSISGIPLAQSSSTTGTFKITDVDLQRMNQVALEASHPEFNAQMQQQDVEQIRHILEEFIREQECREAAILECADLKSVSSIFEPVVTSQMNSFYPMLQQIQLVKLPYTNVFNTNILKSVYDKNDPNNASKYIQQNNESFRDDVPQ